MSAGASEGELSLSVETSADPALQQPRVTVAYTNQPCRRKLQFINGKFAVQKPQTSTVQKRNERERNRVKLINRTFTILRDRLPPRYSGKKEKKLSKVEVLKTAAAYIAHLARVLEEDDSLARSKSPAKMALQQQQQQQQQQQSYSCSAPHAAATQEVTAVDVTGSSSFSATYNATAEYQSSAERQQASTLQQCGDLSDLLNDESLQVMPQTASHLQQLQTSVRRDVEPISADEDDEESGVFQLSSESASSSPPQPPPQMQLVVPVVPPPVSAGCLAMSTPVKPLLQTVGAFGGGSGLELGIAPAYFYPVTAVSGASGADCSTMGESQEFHLVTISDISESYATYYQYL